MSLRSFTVLAHSLRKRENLDLHPARIHSIPGTRSFAFHVVAQEQALILSACRQRSGRLRSAVHPLPAGQRRIGGTENRRLRRGVCKSGASLSRHVRTDVSVEHHLSRIRPCLTRPLARCFSRARRHGAALLRTTTPAGQVRTCRGPRQNVRPLGFGIQKIFCAKNAKKISRTFRKSAAWPWERGTFTTPARKVRVLGDPGTRVASRRSVPSKNRANPNRS